MAEEYVSPLRALRWDQGYEGQEVADRANKLFPGDFTREPLDERSILRCERWSQDRSSGRHPARLLVVLGLIYGQQPRFLVDPENWFMFPSGVEYILKHHEFSDQELREHRPIWGNLEEDQDHSDLDEDGWLYRPTRKELWELQGDLKSRGITDSRRIAEEIREQWSVGPLRANRLALGYSTRRNAEMINDQFPFGLARYNGILRGANITGCELWPVRRKYYRPSFPYLVGSGIVYGVQARDLLLPIHRSLYGSETVTRYLIDKFRAPEEDLERRIATGIEKERKVRE